MLRFVQIAIQLAVDTGRWWTLAFRSTRSINAENLFLRRQLALYIERGVKPRRIDSVTRIALVVLSRLFHWRDALVVVRPGTMIRWHRAGWKLFWRLKSRPGRPPIPLKLQATIRRECLDWLIPLTASHLRSILKSWVPHYNTGRPHMALGPGVPDPPPGMQVNSGSRSRHRLCEEVAVCANSVLGGLHHEYFWALSTTSLSICG